MNRFFLFFIALFLFQCSTPRRTIITEEETVVLAPVPPAPPAPAMMQSDAPPRLVVGIVVDQMRYDYLTRYAEKYGEGGFKRLMKNGFYLKNVHFNYIPTYTAVGHTSVYAGTTPSNHGIISNFWYDKYLKKNIYCVDDDRYQTVGSDSDEGQKSPYRHHSTSVTDELRLASNMHSKVIGIALKDRASILPTGHTANAAYWYEGGDTGKWITSSYYLDKLPAWVAEFNNSDANRSDELLSHPWTTLYDIKTYTESGPDNSPYEGVFKGEEAPVFPHNLPALRKNNHNYSLIKGIPFGNSITTDFAIAAIEGEHLGQGQASDFLAISYSSTDYVGHKYGVMAIETEDTYLRLDLELERLLKYLDATIGNGQYTVFLTSDHGAVHVPAYLNAQRIPGGYFDTDKFEEYVKKLTLEYFKSDEIVENISNFQIFLNKEKIKALGLDYHQVVQTICDNIIDFDGVYKVVPASTLQSAEFEHGILSALQNGYNQKLSGDILISPPPATVHYGMKGTTHGSGYNYDTHAPLLFYGNGIKNGTSGVRYEITDIAPTISALLNITYPNACTGTPIVEVLK